MHRTLALYIPALLLFVISVSGSYPMNLTMQEQIPGRIGASSFVLNDTLYIYGGSSKNLAYTNNFFALGFDKVDGSLIYTLVQGQEDAGPRLSYSTAVLLPDNNTVLFIGGMYPYLDPYEDGIDRLLLVQYTFDNQTWTLVRANVNPQTNITEIPRNRYGHTSTLASDGRIYIYGGLHTENTLGYDFVTDHWVYDPTTHLLSSTGNIDDETGLYGHNSLALPNGIIWHGFGVTTLHTSPDMWLNEAEKSLLYNISDGTWSLQHNEVIVDATSPKRFASTILGPDKRYIYSFGGSDMEDILKRLYRSKIDILDTATWKYVSTPYLEPVHGIAPSNREATVSATISGHFVVALGGARNERYNDVGVLQLPKQTDNYSSTNFSSLRWVNNIIANDDNDEAEIHLEEGPNRIDIVAIAIPISILAVIVVFFAWRYRHRARRVHTFILQFAWKPRYGEPKVTEAIRLATRIILTGAFIAFLVLFIKQVLNSPSVTVTNVQNVDVVRVPDMRFCLNEGYSALTIEFEISCITDASVDCNSYVRELDTTNHMPYSLSGNGQIRCYIFTAADDDDFRLARVNRPGKNNGTKLHFTVHTYLKPEYVDTIPINATDAYIRSLAIHVSAYAPSRNPNIALESSPRTPDWMSEEEFQRWILCDATGTETRNVFDLYNNEQAQLQYQIEDHEYLEPSSWNYFGLASKYKSMPEVSITSRPQTRFGDTLNEDVGEIASENEITVLPQRYAVINVREQRIYTLVNSLGFVGGISGLFAAIHALLFGNRPGSPWGLVQKLSSRLTQQSLYSALEKSYNIVVTRIPFVSPVHPRFVEYSTNDDKRNASEETVKLNIGTQTVNDTLISHQFTYYNEHHEANGRFERMEERIQLLETMLKSYYIDDTLFKSLERAADQSPKVKNNMVQDSSVTEQELSDGPSNFERIKD